MDDKEEVVLNPLILLGVVFGGPILKVIQATPGALFVLFLCSLLGRFSFRVPFSALTILLGDRGLLFFLFLRLGWGLGGFHLTVLLVFGFLKRFSNSDFKTIFLSLCEMSLEDVLFFPSGFASKHT